MAEFLIPLTPPRSTKSRSQSVEDYLASGKTMDEIKRKIGPLPIDDAEKPRLEPPPVPTDSSIADYQKRLKQNLGGDGSTVRVATSAEPAIGGWKSLEDRLKDLETKVDQTHARLALQAEDTDRQKKEIADQKKQITEQGTELKNDRVAAANAYQRLSDRLGRTEKVQSHLYIGNMLIDMAEKCGKRDGKTGERQKGIPSGEQNRDNHDSGSTTSVQNFAAQLTQKQLREAGIPSKYWPAVRELGAMIQYVAERNQVAHAGPSELARILSRHAELRAAWSAAFEFTYDKSVDDCVAESESQADFPMP